jgi:large subunit ribosomal protein L1
MGKKFEAAKAQVQDRPYTLDEAIPLVQKVKFTRFDETVEVALRLGVDPKHADQMVRGTVVLPHGLGTTKTVLVIAGADSSARRRTQAPTTSQEKRSSRRSRAAGWSSTRWSPRPT